MMMKRSWRQGLWEELGAMRRVAKLRGRLRSAEAGSRYR